MDVERSDVRLIKTKQGPFLDQLTLTCQLDNAAVRYFSDTRSPTSGEKSTGLRLAIVKKIIDAHGGEIAVDSEVGRGTTFAVHIPPEPAS